MTTWARRFPLTTFFVIAFAFTWSLLPLARHHLAWSFLALFGPAVGAVVAAGLGGRESRRELRARIVDWRLPIFWYGAALLLPFAVTALRSAFELAGGARGPIRLQTMELLGLIVFVLVIGEEIGWRGFALPRLLERFGPLEASLLLGLLWALWHLPLFFMPGMPQFGTPFSSFLPYLLALSVLFTVLASHTRGSVVIATLFHGAVNTLGFTVAGTDAVLRGWVNAFSYGVFALVLGALWWRRRRRPTSGAA